jgi:hypothetical protein
MKMCTCNSNAYHSWYAKKQKTYCFKCSAYVDSESLGVHGDLCVENRPLEIPDGLYPNEEECKLINNKYSNLGYDGYELAHFYFTRIQEKPFLVMPVYRDGKMVFWTARNLQDNEPKFMSARGSKKQYWLSDEQYPTGDLFIAESIVDACYLSQLGQSVGLLGTSYNCSLDNWMKSAKRIIIAFDADPPGRIQGMLLARYLRDMDICKDIKILSLPDGTDPVDMKLDDLKTLVSELE